MTPYIICHMLSSLDGGLHPSRWTKSPDGGRSDWSSIYEAWHKTLKGDAWMVGRVTMAEMATGTPHAPAGPFKVERPCHVADRSATNYAVALDTSGKLHFKSGDMDGDHIVVLLGRDVPDSHLAELKQDGVSYIVSTEDELDPGSMIDTLGREFGIQRILLEGGASINGSLFAAGLVDELSLLVAPALDGRVASQTIVEHGEAGLPGEIQLSFKSCEALAHGVVHLRYTVASR